MTPTPITDLELYELIVAAYPEHFGDREENDALWDEVQAEVEIRLESDDLAFLCELLGRVVYLTNPMMSPLTNKPVHCIGKVIINDGTVSMVAAIRREAQQQEADHE